MIEDIFRREMEKRSVFKDRDVLSPHYIPSRLLFREEQIEEISQLLAPVLSGKKPNNIFIYGKTGTGKTAVVKYVTNKLLEFARKENRPVEVVYANCRIYNSKYKVLAKGAQDLYAREFLGFSAPYLYEKIMEVANRGTGIIFVLDEIDRVKGVDDLVYTLTRMNDELERGSMSVVGISNDLTFKDRLDPRTKSSLCERELVFPPYTAPQLQKILEDRVKEGFREGAVEEGAISLAAAYAAQESGDARFALLLMLRAGEIADEEGASKVTEEHVRKARERVEEDVILETVRTLPVQERLVLYALARLTREKKGVQRMGSEPALFSGTVYEEYVRIARHMGKKPVSQRWYREYISEMEMYGIIETTPVQRGIRGSTRIIKLLLDPKKLISVIEKSI